MTAAAYLDDGPAITAESFRIVEAEAALDRFDADLRVVVTRLIHACGMPDIADCVAASPGGARAAADALRAGASVLCDAGMTAAGVTRARLPARNAVLCPPTDEADAVAAHAAARRTTRSAAAVELWGDRQAGAVVAIGVAPTALFRLLERLDAGAPKPAAILAFPVGFVGAAESKDALAADPRGVPVITLRGRRGGAGFAAAVNAVAGLGR